MTPAEALREVRALGARPRLIDGVVVTNRIDNRRLMSVFSDGIDAIAKLLRAELARAGRSEQR